MVLWFYNTFWEKKFQTKVLYEYLILVEEFATGGYCKEALKYDNIKH